MDLEEGGALEAARAPLVQESDPQSPGSPFSRLLSTTSRAEDELFRTARRAVVLRDFGGVFQDQYLFPVDADGGGAVKGVPYPHHRIPSSSGDVSGTPAA